MDGRRAAETAETSRSPNQEVFADMQREIVEEELRRYADCLNAFGLGIFIWNAMEDVEDLSLATVLQTPSIFQELGRGPTRPSAALTPVDASPTPSDTAIVRSGSHPGLCRTIENYGQNANGLPGMSR